MTERYQNKDSVISGLLDPPCYRPLSRPINMSLALNLTIDDFDPIIGKSGECWCWRVLADFCLCGSQRTPVLSNGPLLIRKITLRGLIRLRGRLDQYGIKVWPRETGRHAKLTIPIATYHQTNVRGAEARFNFTGTPHHAML